MFFLLLVVAGNETTRNATAHGMRALLDHPEQLASLQADPSPERIERAVEEILRWASPILYFRRTATRDVEVRGKKIQKGDWVMLWYASANRDEEVFHDPATFDVGRFAQRARDVRWRRPALLPGREPGPTRAAPHLHGAGQTPAEARARWRRRDAPIELHRRRHVDARALADHGLVSPLRVVVWATGWIGSIAIGAVRHRPDLELVGVWVHSPEKVGADAGELAGIGPIGLAATNDVDELLALEADCVIYAAAGHRDDAAVPDYVRFLAAGVNVVTVSTGPLVFPPAFDATFVAQLTEAAAVGRASLYSSGIEPGFAADQLPLVLATQSRSISSIRSTEMYLYHEYPVAFMMREVMGFGLPMDYQPLLATAGAETGAWGPSVHMVASALGADVEEIRELYDRVPADRRIETASGVIEAGTCGAVRIQTIGVIEGRDAIIVEHINRMAPDIAPEWPSEAVDGTYRVEIAGDPPISCVMTVGSTPSPTAGAMVATAMRVVNAVPYVVSAPPGLVTSLDLPLTLPRSAFARTA